MKKAIYTVNTNNYDHIFQAPQFTGWDSILFTNTLIPAFKGWEVRHIYSTESDCPILLSREIKILSHRHLPDYDLVCYMDCNQLLIQEPPNEPTWFKHDRRANIYEEARQIIKNGRFSQQHINEQISYYIDAGYVDCGLYLNGFFVRDHSEEINDLHEIWFEETERFTPRDQLTLPFAIWRTGIYPKNIRTEKERHLYSHVRKPHIQKYKVR